MRILSGGALFLLIAAPWFVAVSLANVEFAHFFFVQEHFQRFTSEMHQRAHPAWYFLAVLAAGIAPWLAPLGRAAYSAIRQRTDAELLLWIWALVVFLFFSASGSKLPPYILPIFPALAVLIARALGTGSIKVQALVLIPIALGVGLAIQQLASRGPYAAYASWLLIAAVIMAAGSAAALYLIRHENVGAAAIAIALGGLVSTQIGLAGHRTLSDRFSAASTVRALPMPIPPQARVFSVDTYDHTIPWSLRRTVTMVRHRDELAVAIGWEPQKFIAEFEGFAAAWNAAPEAWAFVSSTTNIERMSMELRAPMQEIARGPTFAIVKKP
jgi:4-amino-4-deoxy-L-arabinose transferase-like glycosyltransferase